jgi:outer membrane protein TolC
MRFRTSMVGLLVALVTSARALAGQEPTDTVRLTLDEAVQRSLDMGEEIRVARAQVGDARGQVREATAAALPEVRGAVVYTRQFASIFEGVGADDSTFGPIFANSPFGAANAWNLEVTVRQTLFAAGKVGAGLRAAKAYRLASEEQLAQTEADVIYRVRRAYLDALFAGRLVEIAEAGLAQARAHEEEVQRFRLAGTRAEYDLLRAQVDAANQSPIVVAAQNERDLALLALKRLVNVPADAPLVLTTRLAGEDATMPVLAADTLGAPERASVRAAEATVRVWEQAVTAARADRWPSLTVGATFSHQAFPEEITPFDAQFRRSWNADLRLSVPLFLGFRTFGAEDRARASLERARAERDQVRELAELEVERAVAEVRRAEALLAAQRATVRQARRASQIATVRYTNGMSTQLEVSDSRLVAQRAEVNEAQALRDYLVGLAELERALGRPAPVERRRVDDVLGPISVRGQER